MRKSGVDAREPGEEVAAACSGLPNARCIGGMRPEEKCVSLLERSQSKPVLYRRERSGEVPGALPREIEQTQTRIATERRCKNNDVTTQRMSNESNSYTDEESNNQVGFLGIRLERKQLQINGICRKPMLIDRHRKEQNSGRSESHSCSQVCSHSVLCAHCNNFGCQRFGPLPQ